MKKLQTLLLFLCMLITGTSCGQSKLDGVFAGAQLYNTPYNGMQIDNIVLLFRSNGTFTNQLNTTGWKTHVSGNYTISNGTVKLTFNNGKESEAYKLSSNGNLQTTSGIASTLHKVKKVNTLPAAGFEKRGASTSGGTGTPMVGAFSSDFLYFDGKGHFSLDHSGVVGIGGDVAGGTIGGKSATQNAMGGTYALGDGEITLTFNNGKVVKQSFFYSPAGEEDLIVLDGEFYFREEKSTATNQRNNTRSGTGANQGTGGATISGNDAGNQLGNATDNQGTASERRSGNAGSQQGNSAASNNERLPSPAELLSQLRSEYAGENIDKITTYRETSTLNGNMQVVATADISHTKIRMEVKQQGKLMLIKQLSGNDGWQWMNGTQTALSASDKNELKLAFHQGILGLHKQLNSYFQQGTVTRMEDDYVVTFVVGGEKVLYLIGKDHSLKGNAYTLNGVQNIAIYQNYVTGKGIKYPSVTETSDGTNKLISTTTNIEINPALTEATWSKP